MEKFGGNSDTPTQLDVTVIRTTDEPTKLGESIFTTEPEQWSEVAGWLKGLIAAWVLNLIGGAICAVLYWSVTQLTEPLPEDAQDFYLGLVAFSGILALIAVGLTYTALESCSHVPVTAATGYLNFAKATFVISVTLAIFAGIGASKEFSRWVIGLFVMAVFCRVVWQMSFLAAVLKIITASHGLIARDRRSCKDIGGLSQLGIGLGLVCLALLAGAFSYVFQAELDGDLLTAGMLMISVVLVLLDLGTVSVSSMLANLIRRQPSVANLDSKQNDLTSTTTQPEDAEKKRSALEDLQIYE